MKRTIDITGLDNSEPLVNPSGKPVNDSAPGLDDGTVLDANSFSDQYNAFWKMVRDTGITPSGLFDNETNGYQLHQAIIRQMNNSKRRVLINQASGDNTEYTIERDVDIVLIGAYAGGEPEIILPDDSSMMNKTVRLCYNIGNAGGYQLSSITNLTKSANEALITSITWCDVHYNGAWRLIGWGYNSMV